MRVVQIWFCILCVAPLWLSGCGSSLAAVAMSDAAAPAVFPTHYSPTLHLAPSPTHSPTARATPPPPLPSPTPRPAHTQPTLPSMRPVSRRSR